MDSRISNSVFFINCYLHFKDMIEVPFLGLPYGLYQITALEYLNEGDLLDWTNQMGELLDNDSSLPTFQWVSEQKRRYVAQIVQAIYILHKNNIVHLDLSLENLMKRKGRVCIIDFGLARDCENNNFIVDVSRGKREYLAPEMLCSKPKYDGRKRDIWSIGVCCYALLSHRMLSGYNGDFNNVILELKEGINSFLNKHNPVLLENPACLDFLEKCLQFKPKDRPLIEELINHPFISDLTDCKGDGMNIPPVLSRPRKVGEKHYSMTLLKKDLDKIKELQDAVNTPNMSDSAQRKRYFGYCFNNDGNSGVVDKNKNNNNESKLVDKSESKIDIEKKNNIVNKNETKNEEMKKNMK